MDAFMEKVRALETQDEQMNYYMNNFPDLSASQDVLLAHVKEHADDKRAPRTLAAIFNYGGPQGDLHAGALKMMFDRYGDSKAASRLLPSLARSISANTENILKNIIDTSTNPKVCDNAKLSYAQFLQGLERAKSKADSDAEVQEPRSEEELAYLAAERPMELEAQIVALYEGLISNEDTAKGVAKSAKTQLFAYQFLSVGKTAPNIDGMDTDGVEFNLTDYRGKVVMLDFWGNW